MDSAHFTTLLAKWRDGRKEALDELTPVMYRELHSIAASWLRRERPGHTLEPTALIHEAYLRLVDHKQDEWHNRAHFFSVASHIMRQILAKYARARNTAKRGGGRTPVLLDEVESEVLARLGRTAQAVETLKTAIRQEEAKKPAELSLSQLRDLAEADQRLAALAPLEACAALTRESAIWSEWRRRKGLERYPEARRPALEAALSSNGHCRPQ